MSDIDKPYFVSYCHHDKQLVTPVVKLLRVNTSFVFQDHDTITPGKKWQEEVSTAIDKAHTVLVFWCNHASQSTEVAKEWEMAIEKGKDLLPLLLDSTPLPTKLSEYQSIDFRQMADHETEKPPKRWWQKSWLKWLVLITLGFIVIAFGLIIIFMQPGDSNPGAPQAPESIFSLLGLPAIYFLMVSIIGLPVWVWLYSRYIKKRNRIELHIAEKLRAELASRTPLRAKSDSTGFIKNTVTNVWLGRRSLRQSFWGWYVLTPCYLIFLFILFDEFASIPYAILPVLLTVILIVMGWASVGVFKSANKRKGFWSRLAQIVIFSVPVWLVLFFSGMT